MTAWQGTCSCGEWRSRLRDDRETVDLEAQWHDDAPESAHVVMVSRVEQISPVRQPLRVG